MHHGGDDRIDELERRQHETADDKQHAIRNSG
jgi:hypothetical protein